MIRAAGRRRLLVLALEQLALALAIMFGGSVLMLLLGTEILHWYWLLLLGAAAAALAVVRIRRHTLPRYRVAQIVDQRLHLSDSLSTAWFLLATANRRDDPVARFQIQKAEELAIAVRPARAFPFTGRRTWALTAALGAVVFGLFAIRYLVTDSLSLQQALIPIHLGAAFERLEKSPSAENRELPDQMAVNQRQAGSQSNGLRENDGTSDVLEKQDSKAGQQNGGSPSATRSPSSDSERGNKPQEGQSQNKEGSASSSQRASADKGDQPGNQPGSEQAQNTKEQGTTGQQGSPGLIDKMKDALSSLMAKMRPNQSAEKSPQNGEQTPKDQQGSDQSSATKGQQGRQQDARNEQSPRGQSSEPPAQGQTTERAQGSQGHSSDQSPQKGSDAHSGIGRQDGDKDLKEAEQLKAMGKLAEIIGKRSANLTGEMMVETPSGKQQLKTAYSQRMGHHADSGGEINRDEIPLDDQQYIREYMELVRKQAKTGQ